MKSLKTPVRTPVASSFAKGWIGTLRRELVDRTIIWNRQQLKRLVIDYIDHYNTHRPHRSLDQEPTQAQPDQQPAAPPHPHVVISTCFNGLISEYRSAAWERWRHNFGQQNPGIDEFVELCEDAVVVTTAASFLHGISYGDAPEDSYSPDAEGLDLAAASIKTGCQLLHDQHYWGCNQHCVRDKSDYRDAGQLGRRRARHLYALLTQDPTVPLREKGARPSTTAGLAPNFRYSEFDSCLF